MQLFSVRYNIIILIIVVSYNIIYYFFPFFFFFFVLVLFSRPPPFVQHARSKSFAATCWGSQAYAVPSHRNSESKHQSFRVLSVVRRVQLRHQQQQTSIQPANDAAAHRKSSEEGVYNTHIYTHNALRSLVYTAARILYTLYTCSIMCIYVGRGRDFYRRIETISDCFSPYSKAAAVLII